MHPDHIATTSILTEASREKVWEALTEPDEIKQYMFGTTVKSGWRVGDSITWTGTFEGKHFEDAGKVLHANPEHALHFTHYSPQAGPNVPENHHTVKIDLSSEGKETRVTLTQDHNVSDHAKADSEKSWHKILEGLKRYLELGH
jgi:uncharacterized protein YndB with AHSA1/START domain